MGPLAASARAYLLSLSFFSGVRGQMRPATCPPMAPASHGKGYVGYCVSHPVKVLECKANTTTKPSTAMVGERLGQFAQGLGSRSTHTLPSDIHPRRAGNGEMASADDDAKASNEACLVSFGTAVRMAAVGRCSRRRDLDKLCVAKAALSETRPEREARM